ncbi:MAG: asparagine synthase-related protein, partial [Woeseiaceae bacterium]
MSGLTFTPRGMDATASAAAIEEWINPLNILESEYANTEDAILGVSYPHNRPSATARLHDDGRFACALVGDPVTDGNFEWSRLVQQLAEGRDGAVEFQKLGGSFAIAVVDRKESRLLVATDALGIQPVYVRQAPDGPVVSTSYAAMAGYGDQAPAVDPAWVYEYLFFNYPVMQQTLFSGVDRLPASSIWSCDLRTGKSHCSRYAEYVSMEPMSSSQDEQVADAVELFEQVVPNWFQSDVPVAMGLSGGLDSRAVLAAVPESQLNNLTTFTYGIPGSTEVTEARQITDAMGIDHREIFLQDEFLEKLPELLFDTVYLSDGLQVINRSNLPLVYGAVASGERPASAILTGVSGDHVFRDHLSAWGNVPYLISADVAAMHREGRRPIDRSRYKSIFVGSIDGIAASLE